MPALPAYATPHPPPVSEEAYLAFEATAETRHEFWHGQIVAMAGESPNHSAVKDDLFVEMRARMPGCSVRTSGVRVRAPGYSRANYAYPDALATCGPEQFDDSPNPPTLLNPTLLVEVTSDSTRSTDLDAKLQAYFRLESLREYWIVDPDRPHVLRYTRPAPGTEGFAVVHLANDSDGALTSPLLDTPIPLAAVYARTEPVETEDEGDEEDTFREEP